MCWAWRHCGGQWRRRWRQQAACQVCEKQSRMRLLLFKVGRLLLDIGVNVKLGNAVGFVEYDLDDLEFVDDFGIGVNATVAGWRAGVGVAGVGSKASAFGGNSEALVVKLAAGVSGKELR